VGLGNPDYGDDGFGVRLAEKLLEAGVPDVVIAGTTPENYVFRITDDGFDHIVFLDAVEFGDDPGSVVFLDSGGMTASFPQISTHKISLGVLAKWVEAGGTTKAWLLGVQPKSIKPAQQLTSTVEMTLEVLNGILQSLRLRKQPDDPVAAWPGTKVSVC
jgi:hydrogenase 3 maturation protease